MTTKLCKKCGNEKNLDEFNNSVKAKDGKQSQCRECSTKYRREWYQKNKPHVHEYKHNHYIDNIDKYREYSRDWVEHNPDKVAATARNQYSKRRGWENPQTINLDFPGSHCHHMHLNGDHQICINIPAELHKSIWHAYSRPDTMEKINQAAFEWLATQESI